MRTTIAVRRVDLWGKQFSAERLESLSEKQSRRYVWLPLLPDTLHNLDLMPGNICVYVYIKNQLKTQIKSRVHDGKYTALIYGSLAVASSVPRGNILTTDTRIRRHYVHWGLAGKYDINSTNRIWLLLDRICILAVTAPFSGAPRWINIQARVIIPYVPTGSPLTDIRAAFLPLQGVQTTTWSEEKLNRPFCPPPRGEWNVHHGHTPGLQEGALRGRRLKNFLVVFFFFFLGERWQKYVILQMRGGREDD